MGAPIDSELPPSDPLIADVAVDGPRQEGEGGLSYEVPERWRDRIAVGQLVWVPLRRKLVLGLVLRLHGEVPPFDLKPLHAPVEPAYRLEPDRMAIAACVTR